MNEELFERYLRNDLDEAGARELSTLLGSKEGASSFSEFVQEWTLLGEAARQRASEAGRQGTRKIRRRSPVPDPSRAAMGWIIGLAAATLFILGLSLSTSPSRESRPSLTKAAAPTPLVPVPDPPRSESLPPPFPTPEPPLSPAAPVRLVVPPPEPEKPLAPPLVTPPPPPPPIPERPPEKSTRVALADVERIQGSGFLLTPEGRRPLAPKQALHADEGVETGPGPALVAVKFPDSTRLELDGDSRIDVPADRKALSLVRGTIVATVPKQLAGKPLQFSTPEADLTILGTQFLLTAAPGSTRLEVREGRIKFTRSSDGASVDVTAGHYAVASKGVKLESKLLLFTKEFSAARDTAVSGAEPTRNFGADATVEIEGGDAESKRVVGLLQWDLSELPPTAIVRSATISLYVVNETQSPGYTFFESKRTWAETEATWKLAASGQPWKLPGARSPSDRGSEPLATTTPRVKGDVSVLLNNAGEALIQTWIRNPSSNHGLLLASESNNDGFGYATRKSPKPERHPRLTITYTLAAK